MPSMKFNPFAENKTPSVSMFAKERPKQAKASAETIEILEDQFHVQEYLGKKMNNETRAFFEALVDQVGELAVNKLLATTFNKINEYGALTGLHIKPSKMHTPITSLPPLPKSLKHLSCVQSNITSLPELPEGLEELGCSPSMTALPKLPSRLRYLSCNQMPIFTLPELPEGLTFLDITHTYIKSLPELPKNLENFFCQKTPLAENKELLAELQVKHPSLKIFS